MVSGALAAAAALGAAAAATRSFAVAPGSPFPGAPRVLGARVALPEASSSVAPAVFAPAARAGAIGQTQGSLGLFIASLVTIASGVALGPMKWRKTDKKLEKKRANAERLRRFPPPLLSLKEKRKRLDKVMKLRRQDMMACEAAWNYDPRDEKWQLGVVDVKRIVETPGYVSVSAEREALGVPMPPFTLMDNAMAIIRGERMGGVKSAKGQEEGSETTTAKRAPRGKSVDLSQINLDFVGFKGIQMTKKNMARLQASATLSTKKVEKAKYKRK